MDVGRAPRRLVPLLRAHRSRRAEAQGHQRADHRHDVARRRAPAVPRADRPGLLRLQRGVLHRRARPEGEPDRSAQRRLADHAGVARARTGDAVDHLRVRRAARRSTRSSSSAIGACPAAAGSATTRAIRDAVAGFYVDAQALLTMGYRGFSKFLHGKSSPEHSLLKLFGSEALQKALLLRRRSARARRGRRRHARPADVARGQRGRSSTCARSAARSPAARARSNATSSPSACSACRAPERRVRRATARPRASTARRTRCLRDRRARPTSRHRTGRHRREPRRASRRRATAASRSSGRKSKCRRFLSVFGFRDASEEDPGQPVRRRPDLELLRIVVDDDPLQHGRPPAAEHDGIGRVHDDLLPLQRHQLTPSGLTKRLGMHAGLPVPRREDTLSCRARLTPR